MMMIQYKSAPYHKLTSLSQVSAARKKQMIRVKRQEEIIEGDWKQVSQTIKTVTSIGSSIASFTSGVTMFNGLRMGAKVISMLLKRG
ncbi:MAG: hypothetical protein ACRC6R_03190 [Bacteroidales bacterium]